MGHPQTAEEIGWERNHCSKNADFNEVKFICVEVLSNKKMDVSFVNCPVLYLTTEWNMNSSWAFFLQDYHPLTLCSFSASCLHSVSLPLSNIFSSSSCDKDKTLLITVFIPIIPSLSHKLRQPLSSFSSQQVSLAKSVLFTASFTDKVPSLPSKFHWQSPFTS